ncbi:ICEBs1 excisionase [Anaerovorax sp. IOR16]|uniref:ICEBs1 excisionase n=1 Tax=Anaerovorax sp. IOR16 TaxID=2773458 RepID=UPI0019D072BE|nr:ICEBs1 excisionase [Anaerovorax sp. IOR16]
MQFYGAPDLVTILGVSRSKAYEIIRDLISDLEQMGKLSPKAGKIQKTYFCERFMLNPDDCDKLLQNSNQEKEAI